MSRRLLLYNTSPQYVLSASNTGQKATSGTVTVTGIPAGITLLVVVFGSGSTSPTVTDTSSNTYTYLTARGSGVLTRQAYVVNPTVTSSMTFTITASNWSVAVLLFTGNTSVTPALDQTNGSDLTNQTSLATGSVTPLFNTELIVASSATGTGSTGSPGTISGYTNITIPFVAGVAQGLVIYYKSQLYIQAENVTFAGTNMRYYGALIASYKN